MRRMNLKIFPLMLILGLAGPVPFGQAGEAEWKEWNQKIAAFHAKGDYPAATRAAEEALNMAEKTYGDIHLNVAKSMNNLANLYLLEGKNRGAEAGELYQKAIAIEEKLLGNDHPSVADTLFNYAMLHAFLGQRDQALPLLERSMAIKEKLGKEHPEFLKVKQALKEMTLRGDQT